MDREGTASVATESTDELIERVRHRLRRAGILANCVGTIDTFVAVGAVLAIFVGESEANRLGLINGPLVLAILLAIPFVSRFMVRRELEPARAWLAAGGPPGGGELAATLAIPYRCARNSALEWGAATVVFVILNLFLTTPAAAFGIGFTMASGGITTSALFYLLAERAVRPLTIRALAAEPVDEPLAPGVRARLIAAWALGTGVPLLAAIFAGVVGATKSGANPVLVGEAAIVLAAIAIGAGLIALLFAANSIARPVAAVRRGLEMVEEGEFDARVRVDDASEVGLLEAGFNRMAAGLEEREILRDLFGRHVGRDVAQAALGSGAKLGGEEREIAALFVDISGSTALAARRPPTEVVALLNRFFAIVVGVVERNGGLVNKFEGDAALCVFGAPVARDSAASDALRAARELAAGIHAEVHELDFGIGVSTGVAVAGNIGAEERFEYTVIGDPVNEASRLCDLAKGRPERVLASDRSLDACDSDEVASWRLGEAVLLRGRDEETRLAVPGSEVAADVGLT
jgi:adenylate cyclase